jgi:IstB-like ATP binding protein
MGGAAQRVGVSNRWWCCSARFCPCWDQVGSERPAGHLSGRWLTFRQEFGQFTARKSLEEFDFDHARGLKRERIAHLGTLDFVAARENVVFLRPPGVGKTHCETGCAVLGDR